MKKSISLALGVAVGDAVYKVVRSGSYEVDWTKFAFMFVFCTVFLSLFYARSVKKSGS